MYLLIYFYYIFTLVILLYLLHICVLLLFILWRLNKIQSINQFAIKYGKEVNNTEYVLLGQNRINWVDSVRHLGNYFNTQLSDITDCMSVLLLLDQ